MKRIVAFGASSSSKSINKLLATYAAQQINNSEITILDLNNFQMPIYSEDYEIINGIPEEAHNFKKIIKLAHKKGKKLGLGKIKSWVKS